MVDTRWVFARLPLDTRMMVLPALASLSTCVRVDKGARGVCVEGPCNELLNKLGEVASGEVYGWSSIRPAFARSAAAVGTAMPAARGSSRCCTSTSAASARISSATRLLLAVLATLLLPSVAARCAYGDAIVADGASFYWPLNDTASTGQRVSDVIGGAELLLDGYAASNAAGAHFDGPAGLLSSSSAQYTPQPAVSVELWLLPASNSRAVSHVLLEHREQSTGWTLLLSTDNTVQLVVAGGSGGTLSATVQWDTAAGWTQLAFTSNASVTQLWVNGAAASSGALAVTGGSGQLSVGQTVDGDRQYSGLLRDVAIYASVLNSSAVTMHYETRMAELGCSADGSSCNSDGSECSCFGGFSGQQCRQSCKAGFFGSDCDRCSAVCGGAEVCGGSLLSKDECVCDYVAVVLSDEPLAYWPLNEVDGEGVIVGDGEDVSAFHDGARFSSQGASFQPSNRITPLILATVSSGLHFAANWTAECWLLPTWLPVEEAVVLDHLRQDGGWRVALSAGGVWTAQVGLPLATANSTALAVLGQWTHVAVSFGSGQLSLYIDGQLQGSPVAASYTQPDWDTVSIGNGYDRKFTLAGWIRDVALYRSTLSAAAIHDHFSLRHHQLLSASNGSAPGSCSCFGSHGGKQCMQCAAGLYGADCTPCSANCPAGFACGGISSFDEQCVPLYERSVIGSSPSFYWPLAAFAPAAVSVADVVSGIELFFLYSSTNMLGMQVDANSGAAVSPASVFAPSSSSWSWELWLLVDQLSSTATLLDFGDDVVLQLLPPADVQLRVGAAVLTQPAVVQLGSWLHVVATYNGTAALYAGTASPVNQNDVSYVREGSSFLLVGFSLHVEQRLAFNRLHGIVRDIAIYGSALSAQDVHQHWAVRAADLDCSADGQCGSSGACASFGSFSGLQCMSSCKHGLAVNGTCSCKGWTPAAGCVVCETGFYGLSCERECSSSCGAGLVCGGSAVEHVECLCDYAVAVRNDVPRHYWQLTESSGDVCEPTVGQVALILLDDSRIITGMGSLGDLTATVPPFDSADFTVEAWVRLDEELTQPISCIIHRATSSASNMPGWKLYVTADGVVRGTIGATRPTALNGRSITLKQWAYVVLKRDLTVDLYQDGIFGDSAGRAYLPSGGPLGIGSFFGVEQFKGYVRDVALYDFALPYLRIQERLALRNEDLGCGGENSSCGTAGSCNCFGRYGGYQCHQGCKAGFYGSYCDDTCTVECPAQETCGQTRSAAGDRCLCGYAAAVMRDDPDRYWPLDGSGRELADLRFALNLDDADITGAGMLFAKSTFLTLQSMVFRHYSLEMWVLKRMLFPRASQLLGMVASYSDFSITISTASHGRWAADINGLRLQTDIVAHEQWTHIVLTVESTQAVLYINGQPTTLDSVKDLSPSPVGPPTLGSRTLATPFIGLVRDVAMFEYVLSISQVAAHLQARTFDDCACFPGMTGANCTTCASSNRPALQCGCAAQTCDACAPQHGCHDCDLHCGAHGSCSSADTCLCHAGWGGPACSSPTASCQPVIRWQLDGGDAALHAVSRGGQLQLMGDAVFMAADSIVLAAADSRVQLPPLGLQAGWLVALVVRVRDWHAARSLFACGGASLLAVRSELVLQMSDSWGRPTAFAAVAADGSDALAVTAHVSQQQLAVAHNGSQFATTAVDEGVVQSWLAASECSVGGFTGELYELAVWPHEQSEQQAGLVHDYGATAVAATFVLAMGEGNGQQLTGSDGWLATAHDLEWSSNAPTLSLPLTYGIHSLTAVGGEGYIELPAMVAGGASFSFMMWARVDESTTLLSLSSAASSLAVQVSGDTTTFSLDSVLLPTAIVDWQNRAANWTHLGASVNGNLLSLYVDGKLADTKGITQQLAARLRTDCRLLAATVGKASMDDFGWWQSSLPEEAFLMAVQHGVRSLRQAQQCSCEDGLPGRGGSTCELCAPGFFDDGGCQACNRSCSVTGACGGQLSDKGDKCSCATGWQGASCDILIVPNPSFFDRLLSPEGLFSFVSTLLLFGILILDVVLAKWKRKQVKGREPAGPGILIGAALALFDVVTDILFTVKLSEQEDSHGLFMPSLAFTAIPVIINCVLIFQFVTRQLVDGPFREWMHKHLNMAVVVIVLSFANPNVLGILTAGYADIALLSAPLSRRSQDQVTVMSMTNNVLEDLPQGIIRVIYLQAELRASRPPSFIDVAGLLTSGAMLLIGMVRRCVLGLILRHGVHEKDGKDDGRGRGISMQGIIRRMTIVDGGGYAPEGEEEEATEVMNPLDTADVEKGSDKKGEVKTAKEAAADCAL
eukprot:PLAT3271.18.p1 GENE.PLAT3271.18~~PLAT3271.18.p1  ORF type:complete len:2283 (-),score=551.69 PLAT3271.18:1581-8429(-)